jgi:hypothetical protein
MDMQAKAQQVLELLNKTEIRVTHRPRQSEGLHEFSVAGDGNVHAVCYPDEALALRDANELALVAAAIFSLLRSDPESATVVVRNGMFEATLRMAGPYSMPLPATC